jgi:hypothetical protein
LIFSNLVTLSIITRVSGGQIRKAVRLVKRATMRRSVLQSFPLVIGQPKADDQLRADYTSLRSAGNAP